MPTLRFHGCSDDTFGEYAHFRDDYDNCASGKSIEWEVFAAGEGLLVAGTYAKHNACWSIEVTQLGTDDEEPPFPSWPVRLEKPDPRETPYSPTLVIEAPDGVTIRCRQRRESDE